MDQELTFEHHKKFYDQLLVPRGEEAEAYARNQALTMHMLSVSQALLDYVTRLIHNARNLKSKEAVYYMQYGAGRRMMMMLNAFQRITRVIWPERTDPLSHEDQQQMSIDINLIYMNISGVLDNFAWCILYEKAPELIEEVDRKQIGMFSNKTVLKIFDERLKAQLMPHKAWSKELKEKRDPVAHRIPLYMPPTVLLPDEVKRFQELQDQHMQCAVNLDFEAAEQRFEELNNIGRLLPCFVHHPEDDPIPLYPTLPTDIANLLDVARITDEFIYNT